MKKPIVFPRVPVVAATAVPWALCGAGLWNTDRTLEDFLNSDDRYPGLRASAYSANNYLVAHIRRDGILRRYLSRGAVVVGYSP